MGEVLRAVVLASGDDGAVLQIGGLRLTARTELPLVPGHRLTVRVLESGAHLVLGIEAGTAAATSGAPEARPEGPASSAVRPLPPPSTAPVPSSSVIAMADAALAQGEATEQLALAPEAHALAGLRELLGTDGAGSPGPPLSTPFTAPPKLLAELLARAMAGGDEGAGILTALLAEMARLGPSARRYHPARAAAARERQPLASSPEPPSPGIARAGSLAGQEAKPAFQAEATDALVFLVPGPTPQAPPSRVRVEPEPVEAGLRGRDVTPAFRAVLELDLPGLGAVTARLSLSDADLMLGIELGTAAQAAKVATALPELTAWLGAAGLRTVATATAAPGRESPHPRAQPAGLDLWA